MLLHSFQIAFSVLLIRIIEVGGLDSFQIQTEIEFYISVIISCNVYSTMTPKSFKYFIGFIWFKLLIRQKILRPNISIAKILMLFLWKPTNYDLFPAFTETLIHCVEDHNKSPNVAALVPKKVYNAGNIAIFRFSMTIAPLTHLSDKCLRFGYLWYY